MEGVVIPSRLQQQAMQNVRNYRELSGRDEPPQGITPISNTLGVTTSGDVVLLPPSYNGGTGGIPRSQMEAEDVVERVMREMERRGISQAPTPQGMRSLINRAVDPVILPQPMTRPTDFTLEFGVPVDTTEIIAMCEEVSAYNAIPEVVNGSNTESWLEMNALYFTGGQNFVAFENGGCPEDYTANTVNRTTSKKHLGAKKSLSESDLRHSIASIAAGYGVNMLVGPTSFNEQPGTFMRQAIANVKEKEIRRMMTLTMNGWDELLVKGSVSDNSEEFDGLETLVTTGNGARGNFAVGGGTYSGTFNVARFDEWLAAGCAKPDTIFGHPTTLQALKLAYWGMGANSGPAQIITNGTNQALTAGLNFANTIMTSVGPIRLVADSRFTRTDLNNGTFSANLYAMRMAHNGEPLVYKATQIPLNFKDLVPGCTAISFMVWAVSALVVKHMCAHGVYRATFSGLVQDGCNFVDPNTNPNVG